MSEDLRVPPARRAVPARPRPARRPAHRRALARRALGRPDDPGAGHRGRAGAPGRRPDRLGPLGGGARRPAAAARRARRRRSTSRSSSTRPTRRAPATSGCRCARACWAWPTTASATARWCCTPSGSPSGCTRPRHCPRCGGRLEARQAGHVLHCPSCGRDQFPRSDPAVIMLVTDGEPGSPDERALLGRSPAWPQGRYSTLAGFVEPGETMEDAVRREVAGGDRGRGRRGGTTSAASPGRCRPA